jgi:hypothetical protein
MVDVSTSKASLWDLRPERREKRGGGWQIESISERRPSVWIRSSMGWNARSWNGEINEKFLDLMAQ